MMTTEEIKEIREMADGAWDIIVARRKDFSDCQEPTLAILNSCSANQRAYEREARHHGIFTAHLLDIMDKRPTTIQDWMDYVAVNVPKTAKQLNPQYHQNPFFEVRGGGGAIRLAVSATQESSPVHVVLLEKPDQVEVGDYEMEEIKIIIERIDVATGEMPSNDKLDLNH